LVIVKPETVVAWHRKAFRLVWTWKVRHGQPGRPAVLQEIRQLIRKMSRDNPLWGAPRIHGELLKLGIEIGETSVSKYLVRSRKPPSQTWRTFLENHVKTMVSVDFFTVPTIRFRSCTYFWCWRMTDAEFCISLSRHIRLRNGRLNSSGRRFRGTARRDISCATATASSAVTSLSK
jgi:hypothetical protein